MIRYLLTVGMVASVRPPTAKYKRLLSSCLRIDSLNPPGDFDCTPRGPITLRDGSQVELGQELGMGWMGVTYLAKNRDDVIIKIGRDSNSDFCNEIAALSALNGMSSIPILFEQTAGGPKSCISRRIVMSKLGNADWDNVAEDPDFMFYHRFARLFDVLKDLHGKGFAHNDIKGDNIRVHHYDPKMVALIDFGLAEPHRGSVVGDMKNLVPLVDATRRRTDWFKQFSVEMAQEGVPDYDKWIKFFKQRASFY